MKKFKEKLIYISPVLILILVWELFSRSNLTEVASFFPSFSLVMREFYNLILSGELLKHFMSSFYRVAIGYLSGSLAGLIIGVAMGWNKYIYKFLSPIISLIYPIPALGWLPILILCFGISDLIPIMIIFICSFFPISYNTASGIKSVKEKHIKAARILGASDLKILFTIAIPLALPNILTGLRLESGMAWRVVIASEMIAIPNGLGALMMKAENLVRLDIIIVCLMLLSLMCFSFEKVIDYFEQKLTGQWR